MNTRAEGIPPGAMPGRVPVRPIVELTPAWARAVADALLAVADQAHATEPESLLIDDCWVGEDLAVYFRYRILRPYEIRLARREPDVSIDLTSGGYALDAQSQGFYLFHDLYAPPPAQWTDPLGYEWYGFGVEDAASWPTAVEQPRLVTLRARNGEAS